MKKYVRCKVCGYIMEEKDLKDVCPACGVPRTAFVEYKYPIREERQNILSSHIHPISVHFPEAIAVFNLGFLFLSIFFTGNFKDDLITVIRVLTYFFPLAIILASVSGVYDAKLRFKKLSPPVLRIKMYLGVALLLSSLLTIYVVQYNFSTNAGKAIYVVLSIINLLLNAILGKMGGKLIDSYTPGK